MTINLDGLITAEDKLDYRKKAMRDQRDNLIRETDWTQLPDSPLLGHPSWLDYRQALRDVPQQKDFPDSVVWPNLPKF